MERMPEKTRRLYKEYWVKFGFRILVLGLVSWVAIVYPEELKMLEGMNFFQHFSILHLLWGIWAWYMLEKFLPLKKHKPIGCMKYKKSEFLPSKAYEAWGHEKDSSFCEEFQKQKKQYTRGAVIVMVAWILLAIVIFALKKASILGVRELLIGSALFYVGDLVCILIWCPFQTVMMKNRCCTQCRIYNWDTIMLITPIAFVPGFFSYSLLLGAMVVVGIWEMMHLLHPERYYSISNDKLQCNNCKGDLGCQKFRKIHNDKKVS